MSEEALFQRLPCSFEAHRFQNEMEAACDHSEFGAPLIKMSAVVTLTSPLHPVLT